MRVVAYSISNISHYKPYKRYTTRRMVSFEIDKVIDEGIESNYLTMSGKVGVSRQNFSSVLCSDSSSNDPDGVVNLKLKLEISIKSSTNPRIEGIELFNYVPVRRGKLAFFVRTYRLSARVRFIFFKSMIRGDGAVNLK